MLFYIIAEEQIPILWFNASIPNHAAYRRGHWLIPFSRSILPR